MPDDERRAPARVDQVIAPQGVPRLLSGWGRTAPSAAYVSSPVSEEDVASILRGGADRGFLARGLGRAYGDAAQNAGGVVLDMTELRGVLELDVETGVVRVGGSCSLDRLIGTCLPRGWFPPVTPGTRHVTVGGAIACDVHGKNHHRDGSFGRHVLDLTLVTSSGEALRLDPDGTPREFWATVGGLGLTGVIVEATLQLIPVESRHMRVDVERASDLDETLARLDATDHLYRYSVAWIDPLAGGRRFGRAVLMRGDHASHGDVREATSGRDASGLPAARLRAPNWLSLGPVLRRPALTAFNELYFRRARDAHGALQTLGEFFYPLDAIDDWNRVYGRGFLQYQVVVPFGAEGVLREVLRLCGETRRATLAVLKRFGEPSGPLSFPIPGWTLAVDIALPARDLTSLLERADELVVEAGGRVYLAKDARLRRERVAAMYPALDDWRAARAELDPGDHMQSDLGRRLDLAGVRS